MRRRVGFNNSYYYGYPGNPQAADSTAVVYLNNAVRPLYLTTYGRPPESKNVKSLFVTPLLPLMLRDF